MVLTAYFIKLAGFNFVSRAEPVPWSVLSQSIFEQSGKGIFNNRHLDLAAWLVDPSGWRSPIA